MVLGFSVGSESGAVKCSALTASMAAPYTESDPLFSPLLHCLTLACDFQRGVVGFLCEEMGIIISLSLTADCVIEEIPIGQKVERPWKLGSDLPKNINSSSTTGLLVIMSK